MLLLVLPGVTGSITRAIVSLWLYVAVDFINHPLWQWKFSTLGPCAAPSAYLFFGVVGGCVGESAVGRINWQTK